MKSPARKSVSFSHERYRETFAVGTIGSRDGAYDVTEPVLDPCEVCGSDKHWELKTFESYSRFENYFEYRCRGFVRNADGDEWACDGILNIHDGSDTREFRSDEDV